jgi:hypothetical protein
MDRRENFCRNLSQRSYKRTDKSLSGSRRRSRYANRFLGPAARRCCTRSTSSTSALWSIYYPSSYGGEGLLPQRWFARSRDRDDNTNMYAKSLPGALGAYGLAVGISHIGGALPVLVFALLSGLNSATVGIVALAAVQLSTKTITDKLPRLLVFFGGAAGMQYSALSPS